MMESVRRAHRRQGGIAGVGACTLALLAVAAGVSDANLPRRTAPLSATTWTAPSVFAPVTISEDDPTIALDGRDDGVVAWIEPDGRVAARISRSGHAFGAAASLSPAGSQIYGAPPSAVDPSGGATVLWLREIGGHGPYASEIQSVYAPAGRRFGRPAKVFGQKNASTVGDLGLGVDDHGRATAFWTDGVDDDIHLATRDAGKSWSRATAIANPAGEAPAHPQYAVAGDGDALAVWGGRMGVYVAIRRGARRFGAAQLLDPAAIGGGSVAVNRAGQAIVVWADCKTPGCGTDSYLRYAIRLPGRTAFSAARTLTTDSVDSLAITLDDRGDTTVAWSPTYPSLAATGQAGGVVEAIRPAGGVFGPPAILAPVGGEFFTACDDRHGQTHVAWRSESPTGTFSELAAAIPPTGRPAAAQTISVNTPEDQPISGPALACGERGATSLWAAYGRIGVHLDLAATG
jgi:hypothetical protein